jgi:isopenicillin-N epimerase
MLDRRDFLCRGGLLFGAGALAAAQVAHAGAREARRAAPLKDWDEVRGLFDARPDKAHFAGFFLATHPRPVREAIDGYRRELDADPVGAWHRRRGERDLTVAVAAGEYLGADPADIALTDSTTMGLGLLYGGLRIRGDQEILTTEHDHYSTHTALRFSADRSGARVVRAPLYLRSSEATGEEMVESVASRITPATRAVAVTWVHSKTGLRFPVRALADAIAERNRGRDEDDRILLCVDGVHGLGAVPGDMEDLGCDFFVAGTHKWMFGPRGTGIVWGRPEAWEHATPTIPPFGPHDAPGPLHTPGGFHSFEHRWALDEAFALHQRIGKSRVYERIATLNRALREGLAAMDHITLHTPLDDELSAGIVCFEAAGLRPGQVVDRLWERDIIASASPYTPSYARLSAGLLNSEAEVKGALRAVRELA